MKGPRGYIATRDVPEYGIREGDGVSVSSDGSPILLVRRIHVRDASAIPGLAPLQEPVTERVPIPDPGYDELLGRSVPQPWGPRLVG